MTNTKNDTTIKKTKVAARSPKNNKNTLAKQAIVETNNEDHYEKIAIAAYYRAEKRGFIDGDAVQDWLEAEMEVNNTR